MYNNNNNAKWVTRLMQSPILHPTAISQSQHLLDWWSNCFTYELFSGSFLFPFKPFSIMLIKPVILPGVPMESPAPLLQITPGIISWANIDLLALFCGPSSSSQFGNIHIFLGYTFLVKGILDIYFVADQNFILIGWV